jgi:hypothetical protein
VTTGVALGAGRAVPVSAAGAGAGAGVAETSALGAISVRARLRSDLSVADTDCCKGVIMSARLSVG